ncbi:MAG: hypothetical protein E1N59_2932 [Puniceicoccaceae bacterium 5H]|nr:MAG: hypothetical protein E1N59_2932 [Puniceicoccaceae bacterium 5H]
MHRYLRFILLLLTASPALLQADSTAYWAAWGVDVWKGDQFSTRTSTENRHDDDFDLAYFRITQEFYYKPNAVWTLGVIPTYESVRSAGDWKDIYRVNLEASPTFKLSDKLSLKLRNWYEIRRKQDMGSKSYDRFRQQVAFTYAADWLPGLTSVSCSNEVFYDFNAERINQDRINPLKLNFKINDRCKTSVFYLYQAQRVGLSEDWTGTHVIGASTSFNF